MDSKLISFVVCAILSLSDSAFVDTINKCSFKDDECVKKTLQNMVVFIAENGIKELNMPAVDPMSLAGISIPVLGMANVKVEEGEISGIKSCVINKVHNDFDALTTDIDLTCDLQIVAKFKLDDISPVAQQLFGADATSGSGGAKLKIDKINIRLKLSDNIIKKDDGNIYVIPSKNNVKTEFDIEKLKMVADKISIGSRDLSAIIEKFINENFKTFAGYFMDPTVGIINTFVGRVFNNVPAKDYYVDDLTSYVKNM